MKRIALISGSQRRESYNTRLLRDFAVRLAGRCVCDLIEPADVQLPLFNEDLEHDGKVIESVASLHARVYAAQGLIVASPEYNGQLTPFLKNTIDWISRLPRISPLYSHAFLDRAILLCSASTGWSGGIAGIPHARALFGYLGGVVLGDVINLSRAAEAWSGYGFAFDPLVEGRLDGALERLLRFSPACPA